MKSVTEQLEVRGVERGGVFRVPAPIPSAVATLVPHNSLGFEGRRWDNYRLK